MTKEELEKEAKEYANEYGQDAFTRFNMPQWIEPIRMERKRGFQKGAEFGYNKANEWHYVKDGDFPKKDCEVVTLHENGNKNIIKWKNGNWTNAIVIPVIAWKEIVLPELKEGEK